MYLINFGFTGPAGCWLFNYILTFERQVIPPQYNEFLVHPGAIYIYHITSHTHTQQDTPTSLPQGNNNANPME